MLKNRLIIFCFFIFCILVSEAEAEFMIADVSTQTLIKGVDFIGREISVSGICDDNNAVIAIIQGPLKSYKVWEKNKSFGIWSNHSAYLFKNIPSYFFVAESNGSILNLSHNCLKDLGVQIERPFLPILSYSKPRFYEQLINIKQKNKLYQSQVAEIEKIGKEIFRFKAYLPKEAPMGKYQIKIYTVQDYKVKQGASINFDIQNIGIDQTITNFASKYSFQYGIIAIFMAIIIGFLVSFLFRKDK